MPTYSYACRNCAHRFDIHQDFSEDSLTRCPQCEEDQLRKVFGSLGVTFKGSGFYRTDARSSSSSASQPAAASSGGSQTD